MSFAVLFKKYLLRSEFDVLSEFGNALADHGYVFDDSTFSRWKNGSRVPRQRGLLLTILGIFRQRGGITTPIEANELLESSGNGYLTDAETGELFPAGPSHAPFQAPQIPSHFTGRNRDIALLIKLLQKHTVVLLHGQAGTGKTSLAIRLCHQLRAFFHDGVLWCRMDTSDVMNTLAVIAHSYKEDVRHIKDVEGRAAVVRSLLSSKKVLLVLDNAQQEHDLRLLIPSSAYASVLITSRHASLPNLPNHASVPLRGFDQKDTITLYSHILGHPYVHRHTKEIATLADAVGRLPLALAITAHQLSHAHQSITHLVHAVTNEKIRLEELVYEDRTLWAAFTVSYQGLSPASRTVLDSLGVFHGKDFPLAAVASLNATSQSKAALTLELLKNNSLLEYSVDHKYRLHPLIRQFIRQKAPPTKTHVDLLASYYLSLMARWGRGVSSYYTHLEHDLDNVLGVFHDCFDKKLWQHVIALWEYLGIFLWDTGHWNAVGGLGKRVLRAATRVKNTKAYATCCIRELCWQSYWQGDIPTAKHFALQGRSAARTIKNDFLLAFADQRLGMIALKKGKLRRARTLLTAARACFVGLKKKTLIYDTELYLGHVFGKMGQRDRAKDFYRKSLTGCLNTYDHEGAAIALYYLGDVSLKEKRILRAQRYFAKSLAIDEARHRKAGVAWATWGLARVAQAQREDKKTHELLSKAATLFQQLGMPEQVATVEESRALLTRSSSS